MNSIELACIAVGSQAALARAIGVWPQAVHQWIEGERPVPSKQCIPIEEATGGKVTRYDLRPDIFGTASRDAAEGHPLARRSAAVSTEAAATRGTVLIRKAG